MEVRGQGTYCARKLYKFNLKSCELLCILTGTIKTAFNFIISQKTQYIGYNTGMICHGILPYRIFFNPTSRSDEKLECSNPQNCSVFCHREWAPSASLHNNIILLSIQLRSSITRDCHISSLYSHHHHHHHHHIRLFATWQNAWHNKQKMYTKCKHHITYNIIVII